MKKFKNSSRTIALVIPLALGATGADAAAVRVGQCVIDGVTQLSDEAIAAAVSPVIEEGSYPTSCPQAGHVLELKLRKAGAFAARVFIDAAPGDTIVTVRVIEGRLARDGVTLGRSSDRVDDDIILRQTKHTLEPGSTLLADKFERAILLLNDLPGIKGSENTIFPAEDVGEANFEVFPQDGALFEGHLYTDNFGSSFTGEYRVGAAMDINSPFRRGEKFTLGANVTELGTYYLSLDASLLLSDNGLRGGVAASYLDYRTDEADDLRGYAREGSVYLHYPILRSRQTNIYGEARVGQESMKDENDASTVTDRYVDTGHLTLSGDRLDGFGGGGSSKFSLEGVVGYLDLGGFEPFFLEDQATARTNGRFSRLAWNVSRLQHISGPWQGYVEVAGQVASKRLDSSQSISFGGPYDFPGYHAGEILGDEGQRLHADLRYNVPEKLADADWQISAFYNIGSLTTHAKDIVGNVIVPGIEEQDFTLQSAGIGLSVTWQTVKLQGVVARRIANEIPDNLLDGDPNDDFHGWLQLVYKF